MYIYIYICPRPWPQTSVSSVWLPGSVILQTNDAGRRGRDNGQIILIRAKEHADCGVTVTQTWRSTVIVGRKELLQYT